MSFMEKFVKEQLTTDPEFKKEWEESELEYQIQQQIIRQIIEKRKQKGLTQTELAEQLNTSQAAIARIESGKQNVTIGYVENIAKALGCKVKIIFE
jgi:ribosome-binding protein aMBF1 (putative translation factor)